MTAPVKKKDFVDRIKAEKVTPDELYAEAKYMFIAMMGLDSTPEDQVRAIMRYLGESVDPALIAELPSGMLDIKRYIKNNLDKEKHFYVVEKEFWDLWV